MPNGFSPQFIDRNVLRNFFINHNPAVCPWLCVMRSVGRSRYVARGIRKPKRKQLEGARKLSALELNEIRFSDRKTVITPKRLRAADQSVTAKR